MEERIFSITDEGSTKIKPLEGTYEIAYKYKDEEEAKVADGTVSRGEALAVDGKFPDVDASKEFEYYALKVTPTGPQGWDAYASKTKIVRAEPPGEVDKEEEVKLPLKNKLPTKEELIKGMKERAESKYAELKKKYPTPSAEEIK